MTKIYAGKRFTYMELTIENDFYKVNVMQDTVTDDWKVTDKKQIGFIATSDRDRALAYAKDFILRYEMRSLEAYYSDEVMREIQDAMGMTV